MKNVYRYQFAQKVDQSARPVRFEAAGFIVA